jgi:hypothetical protein
MFLTVLREKPRANVYRFIGIHLKFVVNSVILTKLQKNILTVR